MNTGLIFGLVAIAALLMYKQDPSIFSKLLSSGGAPAAVTAPAPTAPGVPAPSGGGGLTSAAQIQSTETMTVPPEFGGVVIEVPNEGHEIDAKPEECMTTKNCGFLPLHVTASSGVKVCWVSDDNAHDHTINVAGVGTTGKFAFDAASNVLTFPTPGTYKFNDTVWPKEAGDITILPSKVTGTATAGAVFCPVGEEAAYTAIIIGLGMKVVSSAPAEKTHAIIVYTSPSDPASTAAKITAVTKKTPWT